jgi:hypothetical protein
MARCWFAASAHSSSQPNPRGRHGKESEESKEVCQGDQESRQEDQEDEEVSARFSASQSRRGIATTIGGDAGRIARCSLAENAATIRPAPCAHGSRSLRLMHMGPVFCVRSLVRVVRRTGVSRFPGLRRDFAPLAHPFVEEASGRLQRSCIDDSARARQIVHPTCRSAYRAPRFFESLMQQPWGSCCQQRSFGEIRHKSSTYA